MVNIISSRRGGSGGNQPKYRIRRILLSAIAIIVTIYIISIRRFLVNHSDGASTSKSNSNGPPQQNNDRSLSFSQQQPEEPVAVIAHAISLIKCSKGSSVTGFLDAAAILRHSIHKNSIHYKPNNNNSTSSSPPSRYSYKMYGIVHTTCQDHAKVLERLGYEILVRDHPVKKEDIQGEWLRNHIEMENCCGSAEFIKLYGE